MHIFTINIFCSNFFSIQAEERWNCELKFLEKSYKLEKEKLLDEAIILDARNKGALVEIERKHDEDIPSSHSADSVKEQFKNSLLLYADLKDKKYNKLKLEFKSRHLPIVPFY